MSGDRDAARRAFLRAAGWQGADIHPLAGDASARRYDRLSQDGQTAVLMDADPARETGTQAFHRLTQHLRALGLSAPAIIARDIPRGFLLLEDLGDALFSDVIAADPTQEAPLYHAAAGVLAHLQGHPPPPDLPLADARHLTAILAPFFDDALPAIGTPCADRPGLEDAIHDALTRHAGPAEVLILRDYHAQNLLWLPDREGPARVGLLDYQDARLGPAAYDLASLLHDARRDVSEATRRATLDHFADLTGTGTAALSAAVAVLCVQRNLRILGIFHRLAAQGKAGYLGFVPRVTRDIRLCLADPACAGIAPLLDPLLPDA